MKDNPLIVALDVETFEQARELVDQLADSVDIFKIGSQVFTAYGPFATYYVQSKGKKVFLDLKFHDIPNTVASAVKSAVSLSRPPENEPVFAPLFMLTIHTQGGLEMMRAAMKAAHEASAAFGVTRPLIVGVTVLTSEAKDINLEKTVLTRARLAKEAGLDGVVASVEEAAMIRRELGNDFVIVTQKRVATPAAAIASGSNYLVVGRPIVQAQNPREAALEIMKELRN
jgi:orotidine-5'-phosphate decarboxylase